ncbi:MAG: flagellar assembly protein FliW [Dehalococcoidia bacterium]
MRLRIVRLGQELEVDISEADLFRFPDGIIGFESITEFALLPDPQGGIQWLHATGGEAVAFAVVDPFLIWPDYDVVVADADADLLDLSRPQDAQVLTIITPREDPRQISTNLRAPIVINRRLRTGRQIILADSTYGTRVPILPALSTQAAAPAAAAQGGDGTEEQAEGRTAA